jgi:predicted MFS family arabinose efflux permease
MFLDQLVYTILMPLLPTLKATNNMSDFLVGFMVSCYGIGLLISGPLAGL